MILLAEEECETILEVTTYLNSDDTVRGQICLNFLFLYLIVHY